MTTSDSATMVESNGVSKARDQAGPSAQTKLKHVGCVKPIPKRSYPGPGIGADTGR